MNLQLRKFFRKLSLKTKLMFITFIFIVYPVIILGYFGYLNYADTMKTKAVSDMKSTALELKNLLSDRMTKLSLYAVQILYDNKIYEANRMLSDGSMDYLSENEFNSYLQSNLYLKSELDEILVDFTSQDKVFQVNKSMGSTTDSFSHLKDLYARAKTGKGRPVWYISYNKGEVEGLYITKIIYDINDIKKEIGLLVFKVNDQYLTEVLNNYMTNTKQNVSLYGNDGREIFSYEPFEVKYFITPGDLKEEDYDTGVKEKSIGNDRIYLICDTIQPDNWKLVMVISSNILLKDVRNIARLILILCIATLPICLLLVNFMYSDIIKPMNLLMKRMHQIEKGDIGITIENKREDEFGYMNKTFNRMSLEIKNLINTVYKKQIATKDAEIKALQAQINPHFLYNTLDSINWKAKINGVEEISEMVSALSSIIEANLNRSNENLITLDREIEYINNYYLLLKKRFGKKINLVTDIQENTLDCVIPKLIIQPIIENAVHHGIEMKLGNGTIKLTITREEDKLLIKVEDDGTGIDDKTLASLEDSLASADNIGDDGSDASSARSSIGILNVHKRIRLLYGEDYGLKITSKVAQGTAVTIFMPYARKKDAQEAAEGGMPGDKGLDNR